MIINLEDLISSEELQHIEERMLITITKKRPIELYWKERDGKDLIPRYQVPAGNEYFFNFLILAAVQELKRKRGQDVEHNY